jgi:hypothetical protein
MALERVGELGAHHLVLERRLRDALVARAILADTHPWSEPVFDPVAVHEASLGIEPIERAALVPLYPREPEAVTKWRAMGKSKS